MVTSAAIIMVAVFAVFATLSMQDFKQLGVGLGAAVLVDATLVRLALLPSLVVLLGERSWYLPRCLSWGRQSWVRQSWARLSRPRPGPLEPRPAYILGGKAYLDAPRTPVEVGS
ncbi:MAG TPA: MMPL family transporter [Acidimicrobiales bacterium]|nr:MMPL family transporter [Acidimicrobiales bacterium]